jgi:REP element-mobilizing transposase RayT
MREPATRDRHSIRLPDFDYTASAAYFLTLVARGREELFGSIVDTAIQLSPIGEIVREEWLRSTDVRPEVELDEFVVMPNHLHGIVIFHRDLSARDTRVLEPTGAHSRAPLQRAPRSLGSFISGFKATATRRVRRLRLADERPIFQRNYFERVIRNGGEADRIRQYIIDNPARWLEDPENINRAM